MTIAVKWKGKLVGEIEKGRLTSATKTFQSLWDEFQLNGVRLTGFPDPRPKTARKGTAPPSPGPPGCFSTNCRAQASASRKIDGQ